MEKRIENIRHILLSSHNPLFFFDNDVDGLASFLILRKYCGKGKGVAIKSFPELGQGYIRKINELMPDSIFVLDKPRIAEAFLDYVKNHNYNFVWIDHHFNTEDLNKKYPSLIIFNPTIERKINKPTTFWTYLIANKNRSYLWIAALGCVADWTVPEFIKDVYKKYSDLFEIREKDLNNAGKILYETSFGKLVMMLNFALKDTTTNIVRMIKYLVNVNSPYEILEENDKNRQIHKRFSQIYRKYSKLIEKARTFSKHEVLFFQYGGNLSISSEISNALLYMYPKKIIVVAYLKGDKARVSVRSRYDIRDIVVNAVKPLEDATAGGHKSAVGASVRIEDLPKFKENIIKLWRDKKKNLLMNGS